MTNEINTFYRSEDYRKNWRKKQHVQIISVLLGAFIGSLPALMDRGLAEFPNWPIEGAITLSFVANLVSFYYY